MRIGLFTYGSRGDVQPYIALALRLIDEGYEVLVAAPENFKSFVESFDVPFYGLYGNAEEILHSKECQQIIKSGNNLAFVKFLFNALSDRRSELFNDILSFCRSVDALIVNNISATTVSVAAEYLNKHMFILQLNPPTIETAAFPVPGMPFLNHRRINKISYRIFYRILGHFAKRDIDDFRKMLGLPYSKASVFQIISNRKIPIIHTFSEALIPRPHDWDSHHVVTGFITLNEKDRQYNNFDEKSTDIDKWLKCGEAPIYIGFGSIPVPDVLKLKEIINAILNQTNERIILCQGWSVLPDMPKNGRLLIVTSANHQWLFPQCKLIITHGGIGTLTAALKAGMPSIVISIFADQPIWGNIVMKKQLGIHLPWRKMTSKRLLKTMFKICHDRKFADNATAMGKKLLNEDGTAAAAKFIRDRLEKVM